MKFTNHLDDAEAERLALLLEEMGEATQAIGKVLRHGYESCNPIAVGPTNRERLEEEIGHVVHAIDRMKLAGDVNRSAIEEAKKVKADRIGSWLHHQVEYKTDHELGDG